MASVDLTPFGYTPTESAAYGALLEAGPSSGYSIAKHLSIARANAYQALHGLVAKHAAESSGDEPRVFRAIQPTALFARLSRDTAAKLETLESQVEALEGMGAPDTVPFAGNAEFRSLLMRLAVRAELPVMVVASGEFLQDTIPVWRARAAKDRPTIILSIGSSAADFPFPVDGNLDAEACAAALGAVLTIVVTEGAALIGQLDGAAIRGYWTSDPVLVASARGAFMALQA
jgi:sugar-specific transcriptional regulator TrmB